MQIHDHQNDFVQDKSTNDGIFLLKRSQSLEQTGSHNLLHLLTAARLLANYVEGQCLSAYERVFHLTRTRLPWLDILEHLYSRTCCRFPKAGPTATFSTTSGTRQGGPVLFSLLLDVCMQDFMERARALDIDLFTYRYRINSLGRGGFKHCVAA